MKKNRSASALVGGAALALAALGMTGAAQADNVYWSVGLSSPGVQVGVSNGQPMVVMQPTYQPVYQQVYQPVYQPVYRAPPPVYLAPQRVVYVRPAPVFVAPPQYIRTEWQQPRYGRDWRHGHGHREHERFGPGRFEGERSGRGHGDRHRD